MASCKCRYCQEKLTTTIAYMEYVKDKKFYFCNEQHYEKYIKQAEDALKQKARDDELKNKFYNLMCEILGVKGITNTALWKERTEINKVFSDEVIVTYLEENKDWMAASVGKLNGGEYGKIRYVSVILRNKLGDYKSKVIAKKDSVKIMAPKIQDEHYETKFKLKQRRGLEDLEDDCDE